MSEPHQVIQPATRQKISNLLARSDPGSLGELQYLAIGFRLATMETDAAVVRKRMIQVINKESEIT